MNDLLQAISGVLPIPAKWAAIIVLAIPTVTKIVYGAIKGQGIVGLWRSVMFGSAHINPAATPNVKPEASDRPITAKP